MKTFEEFIIEAMSEPNNHESGKLRIMSGKEAMQHFPKSTMNAVMRHPLYKKYIYTSHHQGFAHEVSSGYSKNDIHTVHAITAFDGDKGVRHKVEFQMSPNGRKVDVARHYTNFDNETYPSGHPLEGQLKWKFDD